MTDLPSDLSQKFFTQKRLALALGLMPLLLGTEVSFAQQDGVSALMEEVVVTARKREEGLQDTPIAVSAYSGDSLDARGIQKVDEIAYLVPNMSFDNINTNGGGGNSAAISDELAGGIQQVAGTARAFAAVKADGSIVTWGDSTHGGLRYRLERWEQDVIYWNTSDQVAYGSEWVIREPAPPPAARQDGAPLRKRVPPPPPPKARPTAVTVEIGLRVQATDGGL